MATTLQRRPDLLVKPFGDDGQHVVKDPVSGNYFNLPPQESFLLDQLDGTKSAEDICAAFQKRFGEALTKEDLDGFLETAREQRLLVTEPAPTTPGTEQPAAQPGTGSPDTALPGTTADVEKKAWRFRPLKIVRKMLYWRRSLFDPDKLLN